MTIQRITREEFEALPKSPKAISPETEAIRLLQIGEGLKFPCRWKHREYNKATHTTGGCNSAAFARGGVADRKLTVRCHQGTVYVLRLA